MTRTLIPTFLSGLIGLPALAAPQIEESEAFRSQKAEVRFVEAGDRRLREVTVAGMRVDDHQLAELAGDSGVRERLDRDRWNRRLMWGGLATLGVPAGGWMVSLVGDQLKPRPGQTPHPGAVVMGAAGFVLVMAGLAYGVGLLNDVAGLERPLVLTDDEVSNLVKNYNDRLKAQLEQAWTE